MTEKQYQDKVKNLLDQYPIYYEVIWGGGFQASGIPDIIAVYKGIFIGVELQVKYNKPSPVQLAKIDMIRNAGGIGAIVWDSLEPIQDILDNIDQPHLVSHKYTERKDSVGWAQT